MDLERVHELGFEKSSMWKTIVLVISFSKWWNLFIAFQCFLVAILCTTSLAFNVQNKEISLALYVMDIFYIFEIICTLSYRRSVVMKKLRYSKEKNWFLILLDVVSVIPLELFYQLHYMSNNKSPLTFKIFIQNRLLRIYRIFQLESVYGITVRKSSHYITLMIFQFTSKALLISHLLCCVWVNLEKSVPCDSSKFTCFLWYETNMASLIILNWTGKINTFREPWERVLISVGIFLGLILIFGYFYPYILYVSMRINIQRMYYYDKYKKLEKFVQNMIRNSDTKKIVLQYFMDAWKDGRDIEILMRNIPLPLKKEIYTDIYWEAFRHSEMLRQVSRNCKRSLSLEMTTRHYNSGEVIYFKGQYKKEMFFLIQGIVQVMSEENEESPILSFSSGTVFGEISLFLHIRSQAIVKCKSLCEFQILSMEVALRVFRDYPKDRMLVCDSLNQRITMARYTQWRKNDFRSTGKTDVLSGDWNITIEDCVKWIKYQWNTIWEGHQLQKLIIKAREEGQRLPSMHRSHARPDIKIQFISNYLELLVLSDLVEEKKDVVCLRTRFPWSIEPSAGFLRAWYYVTLATSFFPAILYPACTAWSIKFPRSIYHLSYLITTIFLVDVILKLFTAVKTKHTIITQLFGVLRYRLQEPTFYLDTLAAFPYQIFILYFYEINDMESYEIGLILHPAILKCHMFFSLKAPLGEFMDKITIIKNIIIFVFLVYWFAEGIQLSGVRNLSALKDENNWIARFIADKDDKELLKHYMASVVRALASAISVPDFFMYPDEDFILVTSCLVKFIFFFFFCYFFGDYYGVYIVKIFCEENFQVLLKRYKKIIKNSNASEKTEQYLLKTINFQWTYNLADYLTSDTPILESTPLDLRKKIYSENIYKTLLSSRIFEEESHDFISEVMEKSFLLAVPPKTMLVNYGHTSHLLGIIHRGVCQSNSFLKKDITSELGKAMISGPGFMFPILSSFCNIPAPASVITLTDCEIIMINLDDLLSILIQHDSFKDIFDVVKELDLMNKLKDVKPGLMAKYPQTHNESQVSFTKKTKKSRIAIYPPFMYLCFLPVNRFQRINFVKKWEAFFMTYQTIECLLWPCCFGVLAYYSHILIPMFIIIKLVIIFNFYINFSAPYYNEIGVLVTHRWYTFKNYLTRSFAFDLICFFPLYSMYRFIFSAFQETSPMWVIFGTFIQRFIKLFKCLQYLDSLQYLVNNKYFIRMVKVIITTFVTFNLFTNFLIYYYTKWKYLGYAKIIGFNLTKNFYPYNPNLIGENSVTDLYLFISHWALSNLATTDYLLHLPMGSHLILSYVLNFVGTIVNYYLYSWISSYSIFGSIAGNIYQEKINSLVKYLEMEHADDKLIEYAVSHYNYEWSRTQGENLKSMFEHLPEFLHEELVYPLYRPTLIKNDIFKNADEGFFKILAVNVTSEFFNRGSIIIFQNEIQSDLYIIQKGKCFVYDWYLILEVGSLVGDLKRTGRMENKIYALTQVEMLKISSTDFYMIINNFDNLEANFTKHTKTAENFVKAGVLHGESFAIRPVDSRDVLNAFGLQNKEIGFEDESYFEDMENAFFEVRKNFKYKAEEKKRFFLIYPGTWKMKVFVCLIRIVTFLTFFTVLTFLSFAELTSEVIIIMGILDFLWLIIILFTFRVGLIDKIKGNVVTDFKFIAKAYLKQWDRFLIDFIALLPFEFIPAAFLRLDLRQTDATLVSWLRIFRLLRGIRLWKEIRNDSQKLKSSHYMTYINILMVLFIFLLLLVNIYISLATNFEIVNVRNPYYLNSQQFFAFMKAFAYVLNFLASSNLCIIIPETADQLIFFNINTFFCPYIKGWIISKILSILYVKNLATSHYKSQVFALESNLESRETSPSLIREVLEYKFNLLQFSRSENMPSFLRKAPTSLRISIMRDLYIQHLKNCPLFENVNIVFLEQLLARMKREIYFSGQKIVEQYDVDHSLYFIHKGEVYVINQTKDKAYVEIVMSRLYPGEYFGESQGLWFSIPHAYTYRARTLVEVLVLQSDDWIDLRRGFPLTAANILDKAKALRIV